MTELLKTYLYHVGRNLPQDGREDILKELEANILDEMDNSQGTETLEAVLLRLGSPEQVAQGYTQATPQVIATSLVPIYWMVLKFVGIGLVIAFSVIAALELAVGTLTTSAITQSLIQLAARLWSAGLSAFGMVTLIFIGLTRYPASFEKDLSSNAPASWSHDQLITLKPEPRPTAIVKTSSTIAAIVGTIFGFFILNTLAYGSQGNLWLGWINSSGIETSTLNVFNLALLKSAMPWINLLMGASLSLNLWLLVKGQWRPEIRVLHIALELAGLALFMYLWLNPSFIALQQVQASLPTGVLEGLSVSLSITRYIVTLAVLFGTASTLYDDIKGLMAQKR